MPDRQPVMPEGIDPQRIPQHIAIIMDGNGRWATKQGSLRIFGHKSAIKAVRETVEGAAEMGVKYLTLYAFSTENWSRPKPEVTALMQLLVSTIRNETETLQKNRIRLNAIGNLEDLPGGCQRELQEAIEATKTNSHMTLTLALSYGARADILNAVRRIAAAVQIGELHTENIDQKLFAAHLSTASMPDPELLIRTSGEFRISNFLLWEIAYAELYITNKLWPDFRRADLQEAVRDYQKRERRFGKTSDQIQAQTSR